MTRHHHLNFLEEDLGYPTEASGRIPAFANREGEAAFWDTQDVTRFVGAELQPVDVNIGGELADRAELARRARAKGIGPSTLVRMWVKERLDQEAATNP